MTYQSNAVVVQVGNKATLAKQPKGAIKLSAPKTATLWSKIRFTCQAPNSLAGESDALPERQHPAAEEWLHG